MQPPCFRRTQSSWWTSSALFRSQWSQTTAALKRRPERESPEEQARKVGTGSATAATGATAEAAARTGGGGGTIEMISVITVVLEKIRGARIVVEIVIVEIAEFQTARDGRLTAGTVGDTPGEGTIARMTDEGIRIARGSMMIVATRIKAESRAESTRKTTIATIGDEDERIDDPHARDDDFYDSDVYQCGLKARRSQKCKAGV